MVKSYLASLNLANWLVVILLIFIPLYPKIPLFTVPGTYVAIRIEDFLIMASFLFWLSLCGGFKKLGQNDTHWAIWAFLVIGIISLSSAVLVTASIAPHLGLLHFLRRVEYLLPFLIVVGSLTNIKQLVAYQVVLFTGVVGVCLYGFGQKFLSFPVISTMNEEFSKGLMLSLTSNARVNSTFAGHYDLAIYLAMMIVLGISILLAPTTKSIKIILSAVLFLSFGLLLLTVSQIAYLATFIGVLFLLYMYGKKKIILALFIGSIMIALGFAPLRQRLLDTAFVNLNYFSSRFFGQLVSPLVEQEGQLPTEALVTYQTVEKSATHSSTVASVANISTPFGQRRPDLGVVYSSGVRFDVEWPRAIRAFLKNPLLGTGYSSLGLSTDNDYLRVLGEVGLLGFWAFLLVIASIAKKGWVMVKSPNWQVRSQTLGLLTVGVVFFVGAIFIDVFEASKIAIIFWMLAGMLVGLYNLTVKNNNWQDN